MPGCCTRNLCTPVPRPQARLPCSRHGKNTLSQQSQRFTGEWLGAGVYLSKDLMAIAGHALKANITTLAPLVLPVSEQLLFFINLVARKV